MVLKWALSPRTSRNQDLRERCHRTNERNIGDFARHTSNEIISSPQTLFFDLSWWRWSVLLLDLIRVCPPIWMYNTGAHPWRDLWENPKNITSTPSGRNVLPWNTYGPAKKGHIKITFIVEPGCRLPSNPIRYLVQMRFKETLVFYIMCIWGLHGA